MDARVHVLAVNSDQFLRFLVRQGCTVDRRSGKGGHVEVRRGDRVAFVPSHGGSRQLGSGLMRAVGKQLGIEKD